jgi:thioesterase domain-containing protein
MCAIKFKKTDKEFQVMQQFFSLMKKYGSVNCEEDIKAFRKEAETFTADDEAVWAEYKKALANAWEAKLRFEMKQRLEVMNKYYEFMQKFAKMEKDTEWEQSINAFNDFATKLNPNWEQFNRMIAGAWLDKLESDYKDEKEK